MNRTTSLFVLSLPRSLSSAICNISSLALDLKTPEWTSDGEILNIDRVDSSIAADKSYFQKYSLTGLNTDPYSHMFGFLNRMVRPTGYVYKDVVQPFVMSAYLKLNNFPVLIIDRNIIDIAYSMVIRNWFYPADIVIDCDLDSITKLVLGLKKAKEEIQTVEGVHLNYDEFIYDENCLQIALHELYPRKVIPNLRYINDDFKYYRDSVILRRETSLYQQLSLVLEPAQTF
jgi:hypothetical protein